MPAKLLQPVVGMVSQAADAVVGQNSKPHTSTHWFAECFLEGPITRIWWYQDPNTIPMMVLGI